MEDIDAVKATWKDEATVYTNIDRADLGTWKLSGDDDNPNAVPPTEDMAFEVDAGQVDEENMIGNEEDDTFTGAYIRENGERIRGTFTCEETPCTPILENGVVDSLEGDYQILNSTPYCRLGI